MVSTGDFKRGLRILIENDPFVILDVFVQTPSARGASSLTKVKVRNLRTGQVLDKTFRGGDRVEEPNLELRPVQFLYRDDEGFHFMDTRATISSRSRTTKRAISRAISARASKASAPSSSTSASSRSISRTRCR